MCINHVELEAELGQIYPRTGQNTAIKVSNYLCCLQTARLFMCMIVDGPARLLLYFGYTETELREDELER